MNEREDFQNEFYILSDAEAEELYCYLESHLEATPCDHTLRFTEQWLKEHIPEDKVCNVVADLEEMGGYCDCEVLMNCYEEYDIN